MKRIRTFLVTLLAFALVLALAACGNRAETGGEASGSEAAGGEESGAEPSRSGDGGSDAVYRTLDEIRESSKINIGVFSDKNPFGYVDENGEYQGYDVYFARRLGQDLGWRSTMCPPRRPTV